MPQRKAATSEALEEDVTLSDEEQQQLKTEETEAAVTPEPTTKEPSVPSEKPDKPAKKHEEAVPWDRFEDLNSRYKAVEQELARNREMGEKWARLEERQKMAQEARQAAWQAQQEAQARASEPNPETDPVGHRAWVAEQRAAWVEGQLNGLRQQLYQNQQYVSEQAQTNDMNQWLAIQIPQARASVPDYDHRVDYARQARAAMWSHVYELPNGQRVQFMTPEEARMVTEGEERVLVERAKTLGIPLHQVVSYLSDQWNYPQWAAAQRNGQTNGNGQVRRAAPAQIMPSANDRLDQIQKGQAVTGLGRVPSGDAAAALAWQQMSNEEFKQYIGNMPEDDYLEMIRDPRMGKAFERRVGEIQLEM